MSYSWKPEDVLYLLDIPYNGKRTEIYIKCPVCGGRRFSFNVAMGIGKCWNCDFSADSASYYAVTTGLSTKDARFDIENRLGIKKDGKSNEEKLPPRIVYNTTQPEAKKKPASVLNATYMAFLSELGLTEKNRMSLHARGMDNDDYISILNYKTFPRMDEIDYFALCKRLINSGFTLDGVPGFFKTKKGDYTFVQLTKGIIMPQKNYCNQIVGLQIRKDDDLRVFIEEKGEYEGKCGWFSSKNRNGGCPANANVHYACDWKFNTEKKLYEPICNRKAFALTEGIMKADLFHFFCPHIPVISVPGVHALENLKCELIRLREDFGVETILLAYDMDYQTNPNVQEAMNKTINIIKEIGFKLEQKNWETKIVVENKVVGCANGIDDYLAFALKKIVPQVQKK